MPEGETPNVERMLTKVGREATFGDANTEIERIVKNGKNFYFVLKVRKDTDVSEIRSNYLRLSRLVHPDKCSHPQAANAFAIVNQAHETLKNPMKKKLYDAYASDVNVDVPEGMSQAEWEAQQAMHPVQIPKWLEFVLRIPVVGWIVILILFPISLAVALVIILISLILFIVCAPVRCLMSCCGVKPPQPEEEVRKEQQGGDASSAV